MDFVDKELKLVDHAVSSEINEEIIVLNIDSGRYIEIKGSGVFIWRIIERGKISYAELSIYINEEFGEINSDIKNDLDLFLGQMYDAGLLEFN
jgi:hypothetical protein